jgi:hypothetical protein
MRDEKGRFIPGHEPTPGGGRPSRTAEEAALEKFRARFRNGNFEAVLDALQRQCAKGNIQAIKLVFDYLLGAPAQQIDLNAQITRIIVEHVRDTDTST